VEALAGQMQYTYFPRPLLDPVRSQNSLITTSSEGTFDIGRYQSLHPLSEFIQPLTLGYRLEADGVSSGVCPVTTKPHSRMGGKPATGEITGQDLATRRIRQWAPTFSSTDARNTLPKE